MAIQHRRGVDSDFDPSKMLPGEIAVTTDGTRKVYVCFAAGDVKEITELLVQQNAAVATENAKGENES